MEENSGADRQIRTADLTLTKGALYQLSHISIHIQRLERVAGIEPASSAWKAEVIASIRHPLTLSVYLCVDLHLTISINQKYGGGRWIRTTEGGAVRFTV